MARAATTKDRDADEIGEFLLARRDIRLRLGHQNHGPDTFAFEQLLGEPAVHATGVLVAALVNRMPGRSARGSVEQDATCAVRRSH